jgi:hypothetical protein
MSCIRGTSLDVVFLTIKLGRDGVYEWSLLDPLINRQYSQVPE